MAMLRNIMQKKLVLPKSYFMSDDVVGLSKDLIGKQIFTLIDGVTTSGLIVETEAYKAPEDKASHAYGNKLTERNQVMFESGGRIYVYLCYGIHHLLNIVTNSKDIPHAILIRAIEPIDGIDTMLARRNMGKLNANLTSGPGKVSQALGITTALNGHPLQYKKSHGHPLVWIQETDTKISKSAIYSGPRVGIDYAKEYVSKPWRFKLKACRWTSKP